MFSIRYAAIVSFQNRVVVIGGDYIEIIAEFKDAKWARLGNMNSIRSYHNAIISDSDIFIIGGVGIL